MCFLWWYFDVVDCVSFFKLWNLLFVVNFIKELFLFFEERLCMIYIGFIRCEGDIWDLVFGVGVIVMMVVVVCVMVICVVNLLIND